jgi:hypothetical protein
LRQHNPPFQFDCPGIDTGTSGAAPAHVIIAAVATTLQIDKRTVLPERLQSGEKVVAATE